VVDQVCFVRESLDFPGDICPLWKIRFLSCFVGRAEGWGRPAAASGSKKSVEGPSRIRQSMVYPLHGPAVCLAHSQGRPAAERRPLPRLGPGVSGVLSQRPRPKERHCRTPGPIRPGTLVRSRGVEKRSSTAPPGGRPALVGGPPSSRGRLCWVSHVVSAGQGKKLEMSVCAFRA